MRHLSGSIIAIVLFCSTVLAEYTPISRRGGIHLVSELVPPPSGGQEKFHTIEFPGPISNYAITADVYAKRLHSSATCGKVTNDDDDEEGKYLCVTSTRQHDQIFSISCLQPSNENSYADIEFLRSGDVMVSGNGTIYAGFTNDQSNVLKMLQGPDKPIDANGDDVGVIKLYILAIFISTLTIRANNIEKDGIKLIKGWQPEPAGGENKTHYITTLGNAENYQIKAKQYKEGKLSSAICNSTNSNHDGEIIASNPCSTCAKDHDQIFLVKCISHSTTINPFAIIQFGQNDEIKVWTIGDIWINFSTLLEVTILLQSALPNKPLHSKGDDVGVIVSCIGQLPDGALPS